MLSADYSANIMKKKAGFRQFLKHAAAAPEYKSIDESLTKGFGR